MKLNRTRSQSLQRTRILNTPELFEHIIWAITKRRSQLAQSVPCIELVAGLELPPLETADELTLLEEEVCNNRLVITPLPAI